MINSLEPKIVFDYFSEICKIPHASGHLDKISNYLMEFAKEHKLEAIQDDLKNVIIIKEATKGMEEVAPIMIQGHMDMVAVKEENATIDLLTDPLALAIDGDYIYAEGTSLGGDDGIAVAYGLAILASDDIVHPRIELVITTDEEVGMEGATGIDLSACKARRLLNVDSEDEGEFVVSCAGGIRVNGNLSIARESVATKEDFAVLQIKLHGLTGGHSGTEIVHGSANANMLLGKLLEGCNDFVNAKQDIFKLVSIKGGEKDNAIPIESSAIILISKYLEQDFRCYLKDVEKQMQNKWGKTDPDLCISIDTKEGSFEVIKQDDFLKIVAVLTTVPNGVVAMNKQLPDLVETSLNLGILDTVDNEVRIAFSLRSSNSLQKEMLKEKVQNILLQQGAKISTCGDYPAWELKEHSALRDEMMSIFQTMYGYEPKILALHAGLECGILASKIPDLDCVSFGPDILDIHTTRERMSISSVQRVWKFLLEVLKIHA